jgi:hypothetical protein
MSRSRMPGFSAEASIYRSDLSYSATSLTELMHDKGGDVIPALPFYGCQCWDDAHQSLGNLINGWSGYCECTMPGAYGPITWGWHY